MAPTKKKVLIIEDEKPMARALELKLEREGFDAEIINNGKGLLEKLGESNFDLIITDLMMPDVDGFEVIKQAKAKDADVPVIVLTNLSQKEDEKKAKELGTTHFYIKSNTSIIDIVGYVKNILS